MRTMQEIADSRLAETYRQPVKTLEDALEAIGWEYVDKPACCGRPVTISSFLGPYKAECSECHRFVFDVTGPEFGHGCAYVVEDYDPNDECRWVSGQKVAD